MPKHIILYVPGLGDHNLGGQQAALKLWRIYGVSTEICPMNWLVDESWAIKLQRLLDRIDHHTKQGKTVSVIGVSAGSTAALQAFEQRRHQVHKVVLVCGKFQYPETVHPRRYEMNPSFKEAIEQTVKILPTLTTDDKAKIRSFRPIYDNFLPPRENTIAGVKSATMLAFTHVGGIAHALTLGSLGIVQFIKSSTRPSK